MMQGFGLYCILRHAAAPLEVRPDVLPHGSLHIPRRVQWRLTHLGQAGYTFSNRQSLREQANERFHHAYNGMRGVHCCVWMDNYYRRRIVANPAVGYYTLSCTVFSVLYVSRLAMCPSPRQGSA